MGFRFPGRRWLPAVVCLGFLAPNAFAGCPPYLCNLATDGAYDKIVIGTLAYVAGDEELARAVRWAKEHGYWQRLPDSVAPYLEYIKLVAIAPAQGHKPMALFMMQREYEAAPLHVGDRVRYMPHSPRWEAPKAPKARALFYGLTGCVATLCRKSDTGCLRSFKKGVFNLQGRQINPATGKALSEGITINPVSMRPVAAP